MTTHSLSRLNQAARYCRRTFAVSSALTLLLTAAAHAKTFPAVPTRTLPPVAAAPQPQGNLRPATPGIPFAGLSIQAQDSVSLLSENQGERSFGTLNPLDTPKIQAVFHLKNETDKPILLERLQPSCHCTHAQAIPPQAGALTVAPGETLALYVSVDLAGHPAGSLEKSVSVYVPGQTQPAAVLIMKATLTPLVALSPPLLDFGTVPAGKAKPLTLTVTVDPRLAPRGVLPALRLSSSVLRLVPQPIIVTQADGAVKPKTITRNYIVSVPANAPLGPISGTVSFAPAGEPNSAVSQAFAAGSVLLLGQVQGEVGAVPQTLSFGTVRQGEGASRQISLLGNQAGDVKTLSTASPSPYITARLLPPATSFGTGSQLVTSARSLRVTLSPQAPAGTMQTQLRVTLASGRRLVIPITAYVSAPINY